MGEVLVFPGRSEESVELAYAVGAAHQGLGLGRQAVEAALALAAKSNDGVAELVIATDNIRSQRVARATGFRMPDDATDTAAAEGLRLDDDQVGTTTRWPRISAVPERTDPATCVH